MQIIICPNEIIGTRDFMIYGHFIEHFHRQIYGGVFDPGNSLSDEQGFRMDVMEVMRKIKTPIMRWPGGCFVSSYHWKDGVGRERKPTFDKSWRVEEPNSFGTDEFVALCRKIDCEPYICTNAGTGTSEEMSDWVEYCNLQTEGVYAKMRSGNGSVEPHNVKYWSIGNENYGHWELGAKSSKEWARFVLESAKMMLRVDPSIELSAAALVDINWNLDLLQSCAQHLDWISIHGYWDMIHQDNNYANYTETVAYTADLEEPVRKVRGLLMALGLEKRIKIAFDEWNLRGWYHPNIHNLSRTVSKEEYLYPRDENDDNTRYTMADAVFSACFLNMCLRNCDIVGMANFAPIINTRGCIFTYPDGIVLRSTYYVFDMFVNLLGDIVLDAKVRPSEYINVKNKKGDTIRVDALDVVVTSFSDRPGMSISVVNKDTAAHPLKFDCTAQAYRIHSLNGDSPDSYNDIGHNGVTVDVGDWIEAGKSNEVELPPHSVNIIEITQL